MTNTMNRQIYVLPPVTRNGGHAAASAREASRARARRRRALKNTLLEALGTLSFCLCLILCAVMLLCVA